VRRRHYFGKNARISALIKSDGTRIIEADSGNARWAVRTAVSITEHELGAGITKHEINHLWRKPVIDRNRDQTGAHDAEARSEILRAIGRKDRDTVAAFESPPRKCASDRVCRRIKGSITDFPCLSLRTQVDDRDF